VIDGIPITFEGLSGWGVVGIIVLLLLTGKGGIALRREVDAERQHAQTWREAYETVVAREAVRDDAIRELTVSAETQTRFLTALDEDRRARAGGAT
jgi:hypothetical protein